VSLDIVRQTKIALSRPGYSISAVVQVQKGAPTKLLIGTDLLSQLGYLFIQTSIEGDDHDMLTATLGTDDNSATSTAISDNSATSMASEDNLITGAVVHQKDNTNEEQPNNQNMRTVCLIQAVKNTRQTSKNGEG